MAPLTEAVMRTQDTSYSEDHAPGREGAKGESKESWLVVRAPVPPLTPAVVLSSYRLVCIIVLVMLYALVTVILAMYLHNRWTRGAAYMITSAAMFPPASLKVRPDRSQFFTYDRISLRCEGLRDFAGWTVTRNSTEGTFEPCQSGWGILGNFSCSIDDAYPDDSGIYWCESSTGERSNAVNITVTAGPVILETPILPVLVEDDVILVCLYKEENRQSTSNFPAQFYKHGSFIGAQPTGEMIIHSVSTADEGLYKCKHPAKGESKESWLVVRAPVPPLTPAVVLSSYRLVCIIVLVMLYALVTVILAMYLHNRWTRARGYRTEGTFDDVTME
ncbi:uncharacterized protein ACJ7VT_012325 [Polymixia lowei]